MRIRLLANYEDTTFLCNHCVKQHGSDSEFVCDVHYHDLYELLFIKEGNVTYSVGSEQYPVPKNTLVFTRPNCLHGIRLDGICTYDRYDFLFSADDLALPTPTALPPDLHTLCFDSDPMMLSLFDRIDYYSSRLSGKSLGKMLRCILEQILIHVALKLESTANNSKQPLHPLTVQAQAYIDTHLLSLTGLEELCDHLSISQSYLHRIFCADLGTTPKRYITERRLQLAQLEISDGAKATAIYPKYGFSDYSSFFRAYKKQFGHAPSEGRHIPFTVFPDKSGNTP